MPNPPCSCFKPGPHPFPSAWPSWGWVCTLLLHGWFGAGPQSLPPPSSQIRARTLPLPLVWTDHTPSLHEAGMGLGHVLSPHLLQGWVQAAPTSLPRIAGSGLSCPPPASAWLNGALLCLPWSLHLLHQRDLIHGGTEHCLSGPPEEKIEHHCSKMITTPSKSTYLGKK